MSFKYMAAAMSIKTGNPVRKLILLKLADNANDSGIGFPSYQYIADECEVSRRTVINNIQSLIDLGFVTRIERKTKTGNVSNKYQLNIMEEGFQENLQARMAKEKAEKSSQGGAGDSLGGGAGDSLGGEGDSLGGEGDSLGGGESPAPRTYHSFEPITEPTNNQPARVVNAASAEIWQEKNLRPLAEISAGLNEQAWQEYITYRKNSRMRALTAASADKLMRWLVDQGSLETQAAVVEQSIRNSWQGLFELKGNPHEKSNRLSPGERHKAIADRIRAEYIEACARHEQQNERSGQAEQPWD